VRVVVADARQLVGVLAIRPLIAFATKWAITKMTMAARILDPQYSARFM
jgi:hypothetical protein